MAKVNILGYSLKLSNNVTVAEFFQYLTVIERKDIKFMGENYFLYVDVLDGLIVGLVLRFKENKKACTSKRGDQKARDIDVIKSMLKDDETGSEAIIFAMHPTSKRGLMYSFSGGVSPRVIGEIFRNADKRAIFAKRNMRKQELTNFGKKKKGNLNLRLKEEIPDNFEFDLVFTKHDVNSILAKMSRVNSISLTASNLFSDGGVFAPVNNDAKKFKVEVEFSEKSSGATVVEGLKKLLTPYADANRKHALKIMGTAHSGEDLSLYVGQNTDGFGALKYDEYVDRLPDKKWSNYIECLALYDLLKVFKQYPSTLGKWPANDDWYVGIKNKNKSSDVFGPLIGSLLESKTEVA